MSQRWYIAAGMRAFPEAVLLVGLQVRMMGFYRGRTIHARAVLEGLIFLLQSSGSKINFGQRRRFMLFLQLALAANFREFRV